MMVTNLTLGEKEGSRERKRLGKDSTLVNGPKETPSLQLGPMF